jgi:hypothetical protein
LERVFGVLITKIVASPLCLDSSQRGMGFVGNNLKICADVNFSE